MLKLIKPWEWIVLIVGGVALIALWSCNPNSFNNTTTKTNKRFLTIQTVKTTTIGTWDVVVDRQTGVEYICVHGSNGYSGLTPLLDKSGKPVICNGKGK